MATFSMGSLSTAIKNRFMASHLWRYCCAVPDLKNSGAKLYASEVWEE